MTKFEFLTVVLIIVIFFRAVCIAATVRLSLRIEHSQPVDHRWVIKISIIFLPWLIRQTDSSFLIECLLKFADNLKALHHIEHVRDRNIYDWIQPS